MSLAKITLLGMNNWMVDSDDDLFKELYLPDGMDKSQLVNAIMYKGAEFEVLYGDPYFIQSMIAIWSDRWYPTFERWYKALSIEYNPLENYDRREDWTDAGSRNRSNTGSVNSANSIQNSEKQKDRNSLNSLSSSDTKDTNEHTVSAYDSSTYQPDNKDEKSTKDNNTTASISDADRSINGSTNAVNTSQSRDSESENTGNIHSGRTHGNIGVTTSQQMLQAELDIARFNLYDEAADLFLQEFCVYTY